MTDFNNTDDLDSFFFGLPTSVTTPSNSCFDDFPSSVTTPSNSCFDDFVPPVTTQSNSCFDDFLPPVTTQSNSRFDDLFNDTNERDAFADSPSANTPNGSQGLDEDPLLLVDIDYESLVNSLLAVPNNNPVPKDPSPVEETSTKSPLVKSSSAISTINFTNAYQYLLTGLLLQLITPPFEYQRIRYENELKKVLRYIFVSNDAAITLMISNPLSSIAPHMSFFLRITRLMKPYGPDSLVLCHPYPIWLNDKNGQVHNGSLFLPINGERIEIDKLILQISLQRELKKIKQFPIFKSDQLDFNQFHVINTTKGKDVISEYQLRYSVLHFQVFAVDANDRAYPTDIQCETQPMYGYEAKELDDLPPHVRQVGKGARKHKSIGQLKKSSKMTKMPKKRKWPEGAHPIFQI